VYLSGSSYVDDAHYAAVNGRDHSFLRRAGLAGEGTHLLPNAVVPLSAKEGLRRTRYLYPVRGSRRKNIGEALLLSLFIPEGRTVAVTLPPAASRDAPAYDHWKSLAARLRLPVEFEIGERETLQEAMGSCFCALTTSIKEGFGFSFLEPWTAGRAVIGRRIDYVCRDFEQSGVKFDACYDEVAVPMVYLPAPLLRHKMESALAMTYRSYGIAPPPYALKALTTICFPGIPSISAAWTRSCRPASSRPSRPTPLPGKTSPTPIPSWPGWGAGNPRADRLRQPRQDPHRLRAPGRRGRLRETYRFTLERPVRHRLSKSVLLELFLDPFKISLIGLGHD
jgi:hypothetical protein